jgi:hypothetical protein
MAIVLVFGIPERGVKFTATRDVMDERYEDNLDWWPPFARTAPKTVGDGDTPIDCDRSKGRIGR